MEASRAEIRVVRSWRVWRMWVRFAVRVEGVGRVLWVWRAECVRTGGSRSGKTEERGRRARMGIDVLVLRFDGRGVFMVKLGWVRKPRGWLERKDWVVCG